jgi:hypothetical protein
MDKPGVEYDRRVLVFAPIGHDGGLTQDLLRRAGIDGFVCSSVDHLIGEFVRGAGVIILTEEALDDRGFARYLVALVRRAAALNDQGVKVPRRQKAAPKPPPTAPADFMKALRANKKALAAFTAFSPSHKREYIEWIGEAKTVETRQRRMATALEWLSAGKSRNWKYQKQG